MGEHPATSVYGRISGGVPTTSPSGERQEFHLFVQDPWILFVNVLIHIGNWRTNFPQSKSIFNIRLIQHFSQINPDTTARHQWFKKFSKYPHTYFIPQLWLALLVWVQDIDLLLAILNGKLEEDHRGTVGRNNVKNVKDAVTRKNECFPLRGGFHRDGIGIVGLGLLY